ncbi:TraB family protein [Borrelia sp. BU AG58]|uniref:TraB/GumN family protein n=1 Tax=Borrelia sp. BU AG58 TaxID=2887345 RepID=UPI001E496D99|nr:TraB family protein [Borrelia sp. BU AG58]UER67590.1 TraB family protein [Borrelia sp. BU AG58]
MDVKEESTEDCFSHVSTINTSDGGIYILGTAHVSKKSSQDTAALIERLKPSFVAVELDRARYDAILDTDEHKRWQDLDIYKAIKQGKAFLLIVQIILSNFQKRLAKEQGICPGEEMKTAILKARERNIPIILADRKVEITLRRAWNCVPFVEKIKIISSLFSFSDTKVTTAEIERLKEQDILSSMMEKIAREIPTVKKILIDERDEFIASKILEGSGAILAIVGAGHVKGIITNLRSIKENKKIVDIDALCNIPRKVFSFGKLISCLVPALVIMLIVSSFYFKGFDFAYKNLELWILFNASFAGLAAVFLGANIVTILTASVGAPIFSLIPFIGTGMVAGLVEAYINKPKIKDFEGLQEDLVNIRGYFKNKVTKILLIVLFVNIGSSIGTIVGLKFLLNIFN